MYKEYENIPDRPDGWGTGPLIEYRGFTITNRFDVLHTEKLIWGDNISLQQSKNAIDASLAMKKLQDKGAALRKFVSLGVCQTDSERLTNQINNYHEQQLEP